MQFHAHYLETEQLHNKLVLTLYKRSSFNHKAATDHCPTLLNLKFSVNNFMFMLKFAYSRITMYLSVCTYTAHTSTLLAEKRSYQETSFLLNWL